MSSKERVRALLAHSGEREKFEKKRWRCTLENSAAIAQRQAQNDACEWFRIIEIELTRNPSFSPITLYAELASYMEGIGHLEPNVDKKKIFDYSNEEEGLLVGRTYAAELQKILGRPFEIEFSAGYDHHTWHYGEFDTFDWKPKKSYIVVRKTT